MEKVQKWTAREQAYIQASAITGTATMGCLQVEIKSFLLRPISWAHSIADTLKEQEERRKVGSKKRQKPGENYVLYPTSSLLGWLPQLLPLVPICKVYSRHVVSHHPPFPR
jgi:hypothetical protein